MPKTKKPENAIFYGNYKEMIYNAPAEQVKEIMTAFCQYAFDNITPEVSNDIALVWGIIKGNIDRDFKQYNARCEKNRENALKRYHKGEEDETQNITYNIDGYSYTLLFPNENKGNLITQEGFLNLFIELEDGKERHQYIERFVNMANEDLWKKPYTEYEQPFWDEILNGTS